VEALALTEFPGELPLGALEAAMELVTCLGPAASKDPGWPAFLDAQRAVGAAWALCTRFFKVRLGKPLLPCRHGL
jgi:hypothetical protein